MKLKFSRDNFKTSKFYLLIIGISATLWFLIRVIPKPSRATYPCMQAAAPLMSSFVIYLLAISASFLSFKKFKQSISASRYLVGSVFLILAVISFFVFLVNDNKEAIANVLNPVDNTFPIPSNRPVGEAKDCFRAG